MTFPRAFVSQLGVQLLRHALLARLRRASAEERTDEVDPLLVGLGLGSALVVLPVMNLVALRWLLTGRGRGKDLFVASLLIAGTDIRQRIRRHIETAET